MTKIEITKLASDVSPPLARKIIASLFSPILNYYILSGKFSKRRGLSTFVCVDPVVTIIFGEVYLLLVGIGDAQLPQGVADRKERPR